MNPLRDLDPNKYHLVTNRTVAAELWLLPLRERRKTIGGIIARAQEKHLVEIYAVCVLSNHYHMVVRAPHGNLSLFERDVNKEIAKRLNRFTGREGSLWGRRFSAQPAPLEVDLLDAVLYTLTNPVHHNLVKHPRHWPGLTSYWQNCGSKNKEFKFTHYSDYNKARRRKKRQRPVKIEDFQSTHTLRISPLPMFKHLSEEEQARMVSELIEERTNDLLAKAQEAGGGFLGRKRLLNQSFGARPKNIKRSPRPACYTKCAVTRQRFRKEAKARREEYTIASRKYRSGEWGVRFPAYSYKPPTHDHPDYHDRLNKRALAPP